MIAGAVLAGGKSRRFGRNKALEVFQGLRLIDRAVMNLSRVCDAVMVVANDLLPYADMDLLLVRDIVPQFGPLAGIFTALYFSPHSWVFVRATDMPFLDPSLAHAMTAFTHLPRVDVVVLKKEEKFEPLMALYHVRCLPHIRRCIESDQRQIISFYRNVRVYAVEESQWRRYDPEGRSLWNINTPEDYEQMLELWKTLDSTESGGTNPEP
ncbi:MAG: molybdenum cofactor guanylyltransferase [Desulfosoma sp.]